MKWIYLILGCWVSTCAIGAEDEDSRGSLVRVRASIQQYDQFRPWQKNHPTD